MKPKVASVPRWKPVDKQNQFEIKRLEWMLRRGIPDRRERERLEAQLAEAKAKK